MLNSKQTAQLRALAHSLKPVVMVGNKGLTDAVIDEARHALLAHELIKVKMRGADDLRDDAQALANRTEAELVAIVGQVAIVYRARDDKPTIRLVD